MTAQLHFDLTIQLQDKHYGNLNFIPIGKKAIMAYLNQQNLEERKI